MFTPAFQASGRKVFRSDEHKNKTQREIAHHTAGRMQLGNVLITDWTAAKNGLIMGCS